MTRLNKPPNLPPSPNRITHYKELTPTQKLIRKIYYQKYLNWLISDPRFREGLNLTDKDLENLNAFVERIYCHK